MSPMIKQHANEEDDEEEERDDDEEQEHKVDESFSNLIAQT